MNLNLERPLVIYDLEATGLKISQAKIIAIGCIKINPDGTQERFEALVNPMCFLPEEITRLTGITSDQLSNQQPFERMTDLSKEIGQLIVEYRLACEIKRGRMPDEKKLAAMREKENELRQER